MSLSLLVVSFRLCEFGFRLLKVGFEEGDLVREGGDVLVLGQDLLLVLLVLGFSVLGSSDGRVRFGTEGVEFL